MLLSPAVFFLYLLPSPISLLPSPIPFLPQEENYSYKGRNIFHFHFLPLFERILPHLINKVSFICPRSSRKTTRNEDNP